MNNVRFWSVFCEDVRIEHDNKCSLIGVMPTVALGNEPFKFRQLCLVYSTEFPFSVDEAEVSHQVTTKGDVKGLAPKFIEDTFNFKKPDRFAEEDIWQVITYISSEGVEVKGDAVISVKIKVGGEEFASDLRFFEIPDDSSSPNE